MKKRWWAGGTVLALVAVAAVGYGLRPGVGKDAVAKADAASGAALGAASGASSGATSSGPGKEVKDGKKADIALEFAPREVVQPTRARLASVIEFSGPLVAPQTAIVRAKAGGTLLSLNVAEGSRVVAGQVLGRIEIAEITSRVAERGAMLESARAALVQAERSHASNERLAAQQFISANALEASRAALDTARAQLSAAQAALDTTRVGLRDATLVAPIAGIVAKRQALPGEKVSPEQPVLTLVDLARLELAGMVGTHEVSRLAPGLPVMVQVEGLDAPVRGTVARVAPAAEPGTRSIGVTVALANPKERLRAGQYALVRAELADPTERLTLPVAAVGNLSGQDHVWLIEGGRLARRAVTLGRRDAREGRVEVLQGLTPDSQVLAARFDNLREGTQAAIVASKTAPVASAAASTPALR